jgi:hypothetical protein
LLPFRLPEHRFQEVSVDLLGTVLGYWRGSETKNIKKTPVAIVLQPKHLIFFHSSYVKPTVTRYPLRPGTHCDPVVERHSSRKTISRS